MNRTAQLDLACPGLNAPLNWHGLAVVLVAHVAIVVALLNVRTTVDKISLKAPIFAEIFIRVRGFEIGLTGNITDRLQAQAGASFMNAKVLESNNPAQIGKTLSNFADTTAFAQLRYAITDALSVGGAVKYESEKYGGQPDSAPALTPDGKYPQPVPDCTVVDLFADYQFSKKINLRMNIGNAFNEEYYLAVYRSGSFLYYGDAFNARLTLNYEF